MKETITRKKSILVDDELRSKINNYIWNNYPRFKDLVFSIDTWAHSISIEATDEYEDFNIKMSNGIMHEILNMQGWSMGYEYIEKGPFDRSLYLTFVKTEEL